MRERVLKLIAIQLLFLGIGCASLFRSAFTPPQVSVEDVEILDAGLNGASLKLKIAVNNPNSIGIRLASFQYTVTTKGEPLASGKKNDPIDIDGKKVSTFTVPLKISYDGLKSGILSVIRERKLPFEVTTKVTVDTPIGNLDFEPGYQGEIPIPTLPDVEVEKVFVDEMGITSAVIVFRLKITNNSDVQIRLKSFQYDIAINDFSVTQSEMMLDTRMEQKGNTQYVSIPVKLSLLSLKRSLIKVIKDGKFRYFIKMNLKMNTNYGDLDIPYEKEALVSIY